MQPVFFASGDEWQAWLAENHATATELLLGFYKKGSGKSGISYAEALDEALAYGWIDGVRKSLGADSFTIRFSPRKRGSIWSDVNIRRVGELIELGRMPRRAWRPSRRATRRSRASTPTSSAPRASTLATRRSFRPTPRRGRSGKPSRPATGAARAGG